MELRVKTVLAALLVSGVVGCATNPKPATPGATQAGGKPVEMGPVEIPSDEPRHGEISFPRPEKESCKAARRGPYQLSVKVRDTEGDAFPGVQVHLFPMGAGKEAMATVKTNKSGVASVVVDPPGVYAVTVAVGGFEPQIRALTLRAGCSGSATFSLKLGPVAGQK